MAMLKLLHTDQEVAYSTALFQGMEVSILGRSLKLTVV